MVNKEEASEPLKYQTWVLKVPIHCEGCKRKVKKVLHSIDGVYTTAIDSQLQKVTVTGSSNRSRRQRRRRESRRTPLQKAAVTPSPPRNRPPRAAAAEARKRGRRREPVEPPPPQPSTPQAVD
ncbi:hypothetical protein QJS04_geneDACA002142 [Acorus gramineus]|uniref:HMA domain-containing protein n=1 Tax=Acorus gramineus TaxID=55184 RepID=A0AAV9A8A2_ACOGR|nr:hypothetical protein QJS04_geneDACA002142 [Acorus gramineus]